MKARRTNADEARPRLPVAGDVAWRTKRAAIDLRRAETASEQALWDALRDRRLRGRKFRRQHAIGPFVVDFYCAAERLVVEIDGAIHDDADHLVEDESRQQAIESVGYRFVRVRSDIVLNDVVGTLRVIESALRKGSTSPSPLEGEGRPKAGVRAPRPAANPRAHGERA